MLVLIGAGWFIRWINQHAASGLKPLESDLKRALAGVPEFAKESGNTMD